MNISLLAGGTVGAKLAAGFAALRTRCNVTVIAKLWRFRRSAQVRYVF